LRNRALAIRLGLEAILLQKAEIALSDAQRCSQIVDEYVDGFDALIALSCWHTS